MLVMRCTVSPNDQLSICLVRFGYWCSESDTASLTSRSAALVFSGVIRFSVPRSSAFPQRPQFDSSFSHFFICSGVTRCSGACVSGSGGITGRDGGVWVAAEPWPPVTAVTPPCRRPAATTATNDRLITRETCFVTFTSARLDAPASTLSPDLGWRASKRLEAAGPRRCFVQVGASVASTGFDLGVFPPFVPAGHDDPVGAGVDRLGPLIVVDRAVRPLDDPRALTIDEVAVVEPRRDGRDPEAAAVVRPQQIDRADAEALGAHEIGERIPRRKDVRVLILAVERLEQQRSR